jgi:hypothetical protein
MRSIARLNTGLTFQASREEAVHLLMQHRVEGDAVLEIEVALFVRQIAVKQDVAGFEVRPVLGKLLDGIAAIKKHTVLAISKGDVGFATRS